MSRDVATALLALAAALVAAGRPAVATAQEAPAITGGVQPSSAVPGGARIDRASFEHQRRIPPGVAGVSLLRLDLAALADSRLSDIRIATSGGFQVPYILEADEPLRVALAPLAAVSEPDVAGRVSQRQGRARSVYAVAFPRPVIPACDLLLSTSARVFDREVSLLVRGDPRRRRPAAEWNTVAWESWRHGDPDVPAPPLVLHLPTLHVADARLVVDEGDNEALPFGTPELRVRSYRLRFMREDAGEMWLLYGRAGLSAPRYDLALLASRLRTEAASEVFADEEPLPASGTAIGPRSRAVFLVALVAAVAGLLFLIARLLRPTPTTEN
jgi:hypothetical protein